jgi:hypothetical protein
LSEVLSSAEIYNPTTGTFTSTGVMTSARADQSATLLRDGRVLIAGGADTLSEVLSSAEIYDPVTGTFSPANPATGNFSSGDSMTAAAEDQTATLLQDGRVLLAGGLGADVNGDQSILQTADTYDPKTGKFSAAGSMSSPRSEHTATLLFDGRVLITGGSNDSGTLASAEIYDPKTGVFGPAN